VKHPYLFVSSKLVILRLNSVYFICEHFLKRNGNFTIFDFLVANGADISIRDNYNRSIIHWAAYTGRM
jgi:ankyrin repeat protein